MGVFGSFIAGAAIFFLSDYFPHIVFTVSTCLFILLCALFFYRLRKAASARDRFRSAALVLLCLIAGFLGYWRAASSFEPATEPGGLSGKSVFIKGSLSNEPLQLQSDPQRYLNEIEVESAYEGYEKLKIEKLRLFSDKPLDFAKSYEIIARLPADISFLNPGSTDRIPAGYLIECAEIGEVDRSFFANARRRINLFLSSNFSADVSSFLKSIITGERSAMSQDLKKAFNVTGLAHILSISGAHFGLLLFVLFQFFRWSVKLLPCRTLSVLSVYISPSQAAAALAFPVITAYLLISSMEFPAVRSFIMISLFLAGLLVQRKGFWLNTLLVAAAIIVLIQPEAITHLSFQLSFLAVLCIGLYSDASRDSSEKFKFIDTSKSPPLKIFSICGGYIFASFMISLSATFGTAALVAYFFNYFSIIGPLSNLIVTPIIGFIVLPLALLSSFIYLISGVFPLEKFIESVTGFTLNVVKYLGSWEYAAVPVPAFPLILLVIFYASLLAFAAVSVACNETLRVRRPAMVLTVVTAILPFCVYAFVAFSNKGDLKVTFLDVGQGDSSVIELPDDKVIVVDTGNKGFQIENFLRHRGINKIDALLLSHGHPDHAGGLKYLESKYQIGELWDNGQIEYSGNIASARFRRSVERGLSMNGGFYSLLFLHPYGGFFSAGNRNDAENNQSVVMKLEGRKLTVLFTGDISSEAEEDLVHLGGYLRSMVIKVPHHGSRRSLDSYFLERVSPQIAVISAGRNNRFGHPHPETLRRLAEVRVFRTDKDGAIGITEDAEGRITIKTWREMMMKKAYTIEEELENLRRLFMTW